MQKRLTITINGKQYAIATDENENDVFTAAHIVDSLLKSKIDGLPPSSHDKAALVVALQIATDLAKNRRVLDSYEKEAARLLTLFEGEL